MRARASDGVRAVLRRGNGSAAGAAGSASAAVVPAALPREVTTLTIPACPMCAGDLEVYTGVDGLWVCRVDRLSWNQWTGKFRALRRAG